MVKIIPVDGQVQLSEKLRPTCEEEQPADRQFVFTRGSIDIKPWQDKLRSLPEEFWDDKNQVGNVKLVRPAHDAWGIQKIIFNFCDDFMLKVLDLPYAHAPEWNGLLMSVYNAIGVNPNKVVRCLLARMPPGVTIPVHHDTGYWVQHTHRCHLPIETSDEVEFWVGPTNDTMHEYSFDAGRIVELNNQAKHLVANKMINRHRVHLIFDYVDDFPIANRIRLNSGEIVYQTRRSIDLEREIKTYNVETCTPRFIIIGAQKSGTTSMYEYICQHPLVGKGKCRESHYFDWRFNNEIPLEDVSGHRNAYLTYFEKEALKKHPSIVTGESTPSYLLHSDIVIPRLKAIIPWVKLIVMFRNPVDRAFSQYQMIIDAKGTPEQLQVRGQSLYVNKTFEQVIEEEFKELQQGQLTIDTTYDEFQQKFLSNRPMNHGGHSLLLRGLYALQLEPYLQQWPQDQLKILSIKDIQKSNEQEIRKTMNDVFQYLQLPPIDLVDVEPKNTRNYQPMSPEIRQKLEEFYQPFNEKLFTLIGRRLNW